MRVEKRGIGGVVDVGTLLWMLVHWVWMLLLTGQRIGVVMRRKTVCTTLRVYVHAGKAMLIWLMHDGRERIGRGMDGTVDHCGRGRGVRILVLVCLLLV